MTSLNQHDTSADPVHSLPFMQVDVGVCVTIYFKDESRYRVFWTLFIELKDPKTLTNINARRDAYEQIRKRYLIDLLSSLRWTAV